MYTLVDSVEKYPEFLPWCGGTDLIRRDENITVARLHIDYHGIKQHFTTENHKQYPSRMKIHLKDGPFKHMDGLWEFIPLTANACKINFELNYEFSNSFLDKLIAPVFSHIANTFVDSFVIRAEQIFTAT
jgi:ribosome-associated toxin RatA of RatAB toxin-antitoxin module